MKLEMAGNTDRERFDNAIKKLLCISSQELKRRLNAERRAEKKRKSAKPSVASRASGEDT